MVIEARKMLDSASENTMLSGGSQARQVGQKSDEKPWGHSQLEVQRSVSSKPQAGAREDSCLRGQLAGGRNQQKLGGGQGTGFLTTSVVSCLTPAHPEAPLSPLKPTVPLSS